MPTILRTTLAGATLLASFGLANAADVARPPAAPPPALVSPAPAPGIQGYFGIGGAWLGSSPSFGTTPWVVGVGGAVNIPVGALNVEFEGTGATVQIGGSGLGGGFVGTSYSSGMVHVFGRSQAGALGAFGGFENPTIVPLWSIGGEAQLYLNRVSLYGQVAYQSTNSSIGGTTNGWWTRGGVQLFFSDNFFLQGDVRYNSNFFTSGFGATTFAGLLNTRFAGTPWSVFGTVRYTTTASAIGVNITTGLVGVMANFGNSTLRQQNTTGASMNTVPIL